MTANDGARSEPKRQKTPASIPEELVAKLRAKQQQHVLKFYEAGQLQDSQVNQLREQVVLMYPIVPFVHYILQLEGLDLDFLQSIFEASTSAHAHERQQQKETIEPLEQFDLLEECASEDKAKWLARGLEAISNGHVAALVLSGGQGTRLGFSGPKGMYDIGLPSEKSLFQLFTERFLRLQALADEKFPSDNSAVIPFFVMTSPMNHDETVGYFRDNQFFGLLESQMFFFQQGTLPCFTTEGKLMLENAHMLATASDGNGGIYKALATSGALERMTSGGVKYLHVFSVDNALCKTADPLFIGYCIDKNADCANKVVWKSRPDESVGVVAKKNGKFCIIEYSEMDKASCERVNPSNGKLAFGAANICNHFYTVNFLVDVVLPNLSLEYHVAHKKIPIADESGETYTPSTNSGIKLESFIFDVFPLSSRMAVLSVPRETEFAPVKNPPGTPVDSPESARKMLHNESKAWLAAAAQQVLSPQECRDFVSEKLDRAATIEISPLVSYNGEGLASHVSALNESLSKQILRLERKDHKSSPVWSDVRLLMDIGCLWISLRKVVLMRISATLPRKRRMASGYGHASSVPTAAAAADTLTASGGRSRDAAAEAERARVESKVNALVQSWGLSRFSEGMARQWLARSLSTCSDPQAHTTNAQDSLARLRKWILMQLNQQRIPEGISHWQRGCPEMVPLLRAQPVWDCSELPWVQALESAFPAIKQELLALKDEKGFQPYRAPSWASNISAKDGLGSVGHDAGDWNVFYLFLHKMDFTKNRSLCPQTVAAIEAIGDQYDHAFFSALAPQTHIKKHHGPTNKKLRCHLPLVVPEGQCRLRVGDQVIEVQEGKCFLFDDSFEHEAWNDDSSHSRIVLIVDVWHPDLSAQEKKFFSFLRNSQLRMDKKLSEHSTDNFFTIIQEASKKANHFSSREAIWS